MPWRSHALRHKASLWDYPFGENYIASGDGTSYQYFGKELDENSGLYYFGARYYDPGIGRWYVPDPAGQGFSPYAYCGNNPIIHTDLDGEFFVEAMIIGYAIYGAYNWMYAVPGAIQGGMQGTIAAASLNLGNMVFKETGSILLSQLTTSLSYSGGNYALSGGKSGFSISAGPFSYNFKKRAFNIANPFDDNWNSLRGIKQGMLDWMSWGPFLYDARDIPGMKYIRFANDLPNTSLAILYNNLRGDKFSHFDWDDLIFYYNSKGDAGSTSMGHTISTGSGILKSMSSGSLPKYMLRTLAHEKMHVLQSGSFGPTFFPSYYLNEGLGYFANFIKYGNFRRPFGFHDYNLFEIWARRYAEGISGYPYIY